MNKLGSGLEHSYPKSLINLYFFLPKLQWSNKNSKIFFKDLNIRIWNFKSWILGVFFEGRIRIFLGGKIQIAINRIRNPANIHSFNPSVPDFNYTVFYSSIPSISNSSLHLSTQDLTLLHSFFHSFILSILCYIHSCCMYPIFLPLTRSIHLSSFIHPSIQSYMHSSIY